MTVTVSGEPVATRVVHASIGIAILPSDIVSAIEGKLFSIAAALGLGAGPRGGDLDRQRKVDLSKVLHKRLLDRIE